MLNSIWRLRNINANEQFNVNSISISIDVGNQNRISNEIQCFDQIAKFLTRCNVRNIKLLHPNILQIQKG